MALFQASGGLLYHLRAWRYRTALWAPFHAQVAQWLSSWKPKSSHLVLIGPSGGYALNEGFLGRFDRISVVEPDVLARTVLRHRFPQQPFAFDPRSGLADADGFAWLAKAYPDAALLFCNLLGQRLEGQGEGFDRQAWLKRMPQDLIHHDWASWHDLASTLRSPDFAGPWHEERGVSLELMISHFWHSGEIEIIDHECHGMAPERGRDYAVWTLHPGHYHLVEWLVGPVVEGLKK